MRYNIVMKLFKSWSAVGFGGLLLATSSLLSRFLGVLRDFVFSKIFGVGADGGAFALDAYFAAFRVPDFLYTLLIAGAMSAAFIPIYTRLMKKGDNAASLFASRILNGLLLLLLSVSVIAWIFAPILVPLIAPGFEKEVMKTTVELTRIMLLSPLLLGLSSVFQGIENSHKTFWGIALAPIVYNLSIILAAWFFAPEYGVYALAWGVVVGAALHFVVQIPGGMQSSFRYHLNFNFKNKEVKDFITLSLPRLFGISVSQFGIFVDTIIASLLALGSISIFNYALNLQSLPYGVVAISLSVAVFSTLSEQADDTKKFMRTMRKSLHTITFWALPAVVGLFILRNSIVELILQGGEFNEAATLMTSLTLGIFIWAAIGQSIVPLFARAFYSLHETKTPVLIAFFAVLLNVCSSLILTQVYGFEVWALAVSAVISASVNALLLWIFLSRKLKVSLSEFYDGSQLLKVLLATGLMAGLASSLEKLTYVHVGLEALVVAVGGAAIYLLTAKAMKIIPSLRGS